MTAHQARWAPDAAGTGEPAPASVPARPLPPAASPGPADREWDPLTRLLLLLELSGRPAWLERIAADGRA